MTAFHDTALTAFQTAAGISADKLSLFVRSLCLVLAFLWAAWCIYGEIHHFQQHGSVEIEFSFNKVMRILFMVALFVALVFIGSGG